MALNTSKCNRLTPLRFKGVKSLRPGHIMCLWPHSSWPWGLCNEKDCDHGLDCYRSVPCIDIVSHFCILSEIWSGGKSYVCARRRACWKSFVVYETVACNI